MIAYENANNVENPSISGVEGGGTAICAAYSIPAYPTVIVIAPNHDIVVQDIWPVPSMQTIIDEIEPLGPVASDCEAASSETEILTFSIPVQLGDATIVDGAIDIIVPVGTDLSTVVPEFTISEGATAYIDDVEQISGTSVVDFTSGAVDYEIIAEDEVTTQQWTVTVYTNEGINGLINKELLIHPNPAKDFIKLNNDYGATIKIVNMLGKVVFKETKAEENLTIDLSSFANGTYIVLLNDEGKFMSKKTSIQK